MSRQPVRLPSEAAIEAAMDVFRAHPGVWINRDDEWLERALVAAYAVDGVGAEAVEGVAPLGEIEIIECVHNAMHDGFVQVGLSHETEILHRVAVRVHDYLRERGVGSGVAARIDAALVAVYEHCYPGDKDSPRRTNALAKGRAVSAGRGTEDTKP